MSVRELRERIDLNKKKLAQELEFRRDSNLALKERQALTLMEDAKKIEAARLKRKEQADQRRFEKRRNSEMQTQQEQSRREGGLKLAYEKISTKKQLKAENDARLAQELKEISLQRQYMNANAAMVEYKQWQGIEQGKERMIRDAQNEKLIEQSKLNGIKVSD